MVIKELEQAYVVRLERGEELMSALLGFANVHQIDGAFFHGLGGALRASLGIYRLDEDKQYHYREFAGPLEVISINGNISMVETERMVHAHATISGPDLVVSGGHIDNLDIGATCELFVDLRTGSLRRTYNDDIGLKLLDFDSNGNGPRA